MKRVLFSVFTMGLLTSSLTFACSNPETVTATQLRLNLLKSETTIKNLKIGSKVKNQDGKPAFTVAVTFETKKVDGYRNKQSAVYIANVNSDCSIKSEQLVYVDNYLNRYFNN